MCLFEGPGGLYFFCIILILRWRSERMLIQVLRSKTDPDQDVVTSETAPFAVSWLSHAVQLRGLRVCQLLRNS